MSGGFTHEAAPATVEWYTPPWIFEALGIVFDLDPCSPTGRVLEWVPAARRYTREDDGLRQPWAGRVWCNPPYGSETKRWLQRLGDHGNGIALVFARTEAGWFHDAASTADAVLFFRGRIRFVASDLRDGDSPAAGSVLLAWGEENVAALERMASAGHGLCVRLPRPKAAAQIELDLGSAA